ncbi:MAG: hydrogen gas-evolving membrane-bound hydrogenase subunit E, partial [Planctomycetota bacterium]
GIDSTLIGIAFLLCFVGGGAKSAQWPLHFWLPGAMAAPTPVSAYLHSATMVKAGVYLFARLFPTLSDVPAVNWTGVLCGFGTTTMLVGAYLALRANELKKVFAYTTVSQLGLLTCAYGLGGLTYKDEANIIWPVMQILNHALYKAPLFIIAGAIMHIVGRKEWPQLRGLLRTHPLLAIICLAGCYALAGLPLTLSFSGKEMFFYQIVHAGESHSLGAWIIGIAGVATGACNVCIFLRFLTTFVAKPVASAPRIEHAPHASMDNPEEHAHDHDHHQHERGFWGACIWLPAALLVSLQFLGGIAPSVFESIFGAVETNPTKPLADLGFLHAVMHPSLPLAMTGMAILGGFVLFVPRLLRAPEVDPFDGAFPNIYKGLERLGYRATRILQNGDVRTYICGVLLALAMGLAAAAIMRPEILEWPNPASFFGADIGFFLISIFVAMLICTTALLLPIVHSRVVRVLVLGTCGFGILGMYLVYQAPDLALTQLMFEIISVILFLLVLRLLPEEPRKRVDRTRPIRAVVASVMGLMIGWVVLQAGSQADANAIRAAELAQAKSAVVHVADADTAVDGAEDKAKALEVYEPTGRLGDWFLKHSYKGTADTDGRGGGGSNVVNVILVDFRGYDTLGEITVLAIAMMGVMAMLGAVGPNIAGPGDRNCVHVAPPVPQPHLRSILLRTAMKLILPLALIFALYVFFKGHNEPGGGFIAGLIGSVGLAVFRMTEGPGALKGLIPFRPSKIAAFGLMIALATGALPLLLQLFNLSDNAPFLTSYQAYIPRFGADPFHMTSVMLFDLGVFIVVIGVSVGMINRFEEELE